MGEPDVRARAGASSRRCPPIPGVPSRRSRLHTEQDCERQLYESDHRCRPLMWGAQESMARSRGTRRATRRQPRTRVLLGKTWAEQTEARHYGLSHCQRGRSANVGRPRRPPCEQRRLLHRYYNNCGEAIGSRDAHGSRIGVAAPFVSPPSDAPASRARVGRVPRPPRGPRETPRRGRQQRRQRSIDPAVGARSGGAHSEIPCRHGESRGSDARACFDVQRPTAGLLASVTHGKPTRRPAAGARPADPSRFDGRPTCAARGGWLAQREGRSPREMTRLRGPDQ